MTVQSMDDASPAKWHLAHTTWFHEEFVLLPFVSGYCAFDDRYRFLFNSYYESIGARHPRPRRGLLTRPALAEVLAYRAHVDAAIEALLGQDPPAMAALRIELGVHHEEQHQELFLTDLLHLFAQNPLRPPFRDRGARPTRPSAVGAATAWVDFPGGRFHIGHGGEGFAFDCETPRHEVLLRPYALATRLVTNRDWTNFIDDGGYRTASLWLSDGWQRCQAENWHAPLYWELRDGAWSHMTLVGEQGVDTEAPVDHVSFYEAEAFARWAGQRLPTEFEWEIAAREQSVHGNFAGSNEWRPRGVRSDDAGPLKQLYGDVWEWTASPYGAYPGFRPAPGAVGEYNGKFMCSQFVLRGGSCATPDGHVRASYRNFFYPHQRWQFSGLRLATDRS